VFEFLYKFCPKYFSRWEDLSEVLSYMYTRLHKSTANSSPISTTLEFSRQIFGKKILRYQMWSESCQWEPRCSVQTDGHWKTDNLFFKILQTKSNTDNWSFSQQQFFCYCSPIPLKIEQQVSFIFAVCNSVGVIWNCNLYVSRHTNCMFSQCVKIFA
jgi:hypothetical protein